MARKPVTLAEHCARIAAKGGAARSKAKARAARRNAKKPRPLARLRNAERRLAKEKAKVEPACCRTCGKPL